MGSWTADKFRVHLLIVEDVIYCSGGWDGATRKCWRSETPMVRR